MRKRGAADGRKRNMTLEQFIRRNGIIAQHLEQIAAMNGAEHLLEFSLNFNPTMRDLLTAQERLLNAAEKVIKIRSETLRCEAAVQS